MHKSRKSRHESHSDPELDISSLIDVSFLLLIFFLVTSTLLKKELDLGLVLPTPGESKVDPSESLEIAISGDGRITIGGQEIAGPSKNGDASQITEVRAQLKEHKNRADILQQEAFVSLKASDEATTQRFIDVINALAYAGIDHIAMQDDLAAN